MSGSCPKKKEKMKEGRNGGRAGEREGEGGEGRGGQGGKKLIWGEDTFQPSPCYLREAE